MFNLRMKATNVKNRGFSSGILQENIWCLTLLMIPISSIYVTISLLLSLIVSVFFFFLFLFTASCSFNPLEFRCANIAINVAIL